MSVACMLITHLPLKAELQREPVLHGRRVIVVRTLRKKSEVVDFSPGLRLKAGMPLSEATTLVGSVCVVEADTAFCQERFQEILSALLRHSPVVENAGVGLAYVGLHGLELLYGGDGRLAATLSREVPPAFKARVGVGANKFIAYLAATHAKPGEVFVAPSSDARFVQRFPLDLLPVELEIRQKLRLFGLRTLGDVAGLGVGPLQAQFGVTGKQIWELSNGVDSRPLVPMQEEESITEHLGLPFVASTLEVLTRTVDLLLRRAFGRPQMRGKFASRVTIGCDTTRPPAWSRSFQLREAAGYASKAMAAIAARLDQDPPRDGFEGVSVTLSGFTGEPSKQPGLLRDARDRRKDFAEVDEQLRPKFQGLPALYRVVAMQPRHPLPEMRAIQVPVDTAAGDAVKALQTPVPIDVEGGDGLAPRCLRLGKRRVSVRVVEDWWKVNLWWLAQPLERLYLRLACADGTSVTVFRDQASGRWYRQSY